MNEPQTSQPQQQPRRISLFDSDGLPWTAHLSLGWILAVFTVTGGMAGIPIGIYLGLWIRAKTQSALALLIYILLAGACATLFLPDSLITPHRADAVGLAVVVLWFAGALIGRQQIVRYYTQREGFKFRLTTALTLLFGVWYLNYRIRPEFPNDSWAGPLV